MQAEQHRPRLKHTPEIPLARIATVSLALILGATALMLAVFGGLTIAQTFQEYQDSADSVYVTIGTIELLVGAVFGMGALLTLTGAHHPRGWLGVAVLAFLGSALPYADLVGTAGFAANAGLGLLAIGAAVRYLRAAGRGAPQR
jgi:hypothetical protein